jgi:cytochrome c-type biogenesis protein CcmH/NrfF
MTPPYDQLDAQIKQLFRQGCSQNQVLQQLTANYPQLVNQAAQVLKRIQAIERELRQAGR